jgi:hypothetical protein
MTPDIAKSTHRVEVVPVVLEKHPDADTLSVVRVFGYTVCVRTADWEGRTVGAYIPPDSVVPDTPEYAFLGENRRIKVRRLRGVVSMGLLVPAPEGAKIGDDVAERLGIGHYEPPLSFKTGGDVEEAPAGYRPVYDVDTWYRYKQLLRPGEEVRVTEKIHGASGRWVFQDGRMWSAVVEAGRREPLVEGLEVQPLDRGVLPRCPRRHRLRRGLRPGPGPPLRRPAEPRGGRRLRRPLGLGLVAGREGGGRARRPPRAAPLRRPL